ncbi:hypothetical protein OSCI_3960017 [Kamptonema sp. PCC 6506]|nr:hypothetical protein OSCI_3960017 [Kamptonema sp. PCC 6506]
MMPKCFEQTWNKRTKEIALLSWVARDDLKGDFIVEFGRP